MNAAPPVHTPYPPMAAAAVRHAYGSDSDSENENNAHCPGTPDRAHVEAAMRGPVQTPPRADEDVASPKNSQAEEAASSKIARPAVVVVVTAFGFGSLVVLVVPVPTPNRSPCSYS